MDDKTKILIIRLSALGDTIHTLPLANAIKKAYPNCQLGWVVEDKAQHFVHNNPLVDKCFVIPKKQWKKRGFSFKNLKEFFEIIRNIRKEKYDIVLDTQQLLKSSIIMGLSGGKRKITHNNGRELSWLFANEIIKSDRKQFDVDYHVVYRNFDFAKYLKIDDETIEFRLPEPSEESTKKAKDLLKDIDSSKPVIILAPATTWANKHWKKEYWTALISEFIDRANIVMTGSSADIELTNSIIAQLNDKRILNLTGKTNLEELTEIFKLSDIVISPDSGSAHIAWAVQKPYVITIFCATSKNRTGPFGDKYFSVAPDLECSPCMKKTCRLDKDKNICSSKVYVEEIIKIVNNLLH